MTRPNPNPNHPFSAIRESGDRRLITRLPNRERQDEWTAIAAAQAAVISREQLCASGISSALAGRLVTRGRLDRIALGVFLVRGAPLTLEAQRWAAVLATDGVLGFASAAHLWRTIDIRPDQVHVVLAHSRRVYPPPWVRVHRVPLPRAATTRIDGLPVSVRAWTLLDFLPTLPPSQALRLADRALQQEWITLDDLRGRLRDFPGRTGNGSVRRILQTVQDGAAAESERILHRLLRRAGVTGWKPNYPVPLPNGGVAELDVAIPARRVAIEVDGMAHHIDVERFQRDRTRQNGVVISGWTILRFTWFDLTERPNYVIATIRRALNANSGVS